MRKKIVAGNWKCNTTVPAGVELAKAVTEAVVNGGDPEVQVIVCPPFVHLTKVVESLDLGRVKAGAQNCAAEAKGAYTGEVSAEMVRSTGAEYVILGHSERREYYGETSATSTRSWPRFLHRDSRPSIAAGSLCPSGKPVPRTTM